MMKLYFLQDVSGPFLYGTLNRRPQMTLPRPRSDRLGSESSSITNHIDLPVMTSSISAYNNNTGMSGQDIWTPMAVHHSHPGHGAHCGGGYQMPGTVGNGGPGNGSVASSLRSESPISSGKTFTQSLNVSTTPLQQWGFRQCLPFSWTTLRGKHCRHPIAVMGVVDTFGDFG